MQTSFWAALAAARGQRHSAAMRIALYQPEIAGNVGAVLRVAACFGVPVDVIEPTGFVWSDAKLRRAGMDYAERVDVTRHANWGAFAAARPAPVLLTTHGDVSLFEHAFDANDVLLFGQESAGVPPEVAAACRARVRIPLTADSRSLNLAVSVGIAVAEALRRTGGLPG